jgi:hypothetical protein
VDRLVTAAERALAAGNHLDALNWVALRDDTPARALRGIAMAQIGDLVHARVLLRRAARAFGPKEAVARACWVVARVAMRRLWTKTARAALVRAERGARHAGISALKRFKTLLRSTIVFPQSLNERKFRL